MEFDDDVADHAVIPAQAGIHAGGQAPRRAGAHWAEQYVGLPYLPDVFDCAHLVERVQRERFGRDVRLPQHRVSRKSRDLSEQIAAELEHYLAPREGEPQEGDCVLMVGAGRRNHIGVLASLAGEAWVLHNFIRGREVALHRVRDLVFYGLTVEGFYRWK